MNWLTKRSVLHPEAFSQTELLQQKMLFFTFLCILVETLLYVHRNCRFIRDRSPGRPPGPSHSSWNLICIFDMCRTASSIMFCPWLVCGAVFWLIWFFFVYFFLCLCVVLGLDWFVVLCFCLWSFCVGLFSVICRYFAIFFLFCWLICVGLHPDLWRSASWVICLCPTDLCILSDFFKIVVYKDALTKLTALIIDKCYLSFLSVIALGVGGGIYIFFCFLFFFKFLFFPQVFWVLPSTSLWDVFIF